MRYLNEAIDDICWSNWSYLYLRLVPCAPKYFEEGEKTRKWEERAGAILNIHTYNLSALLFGMGGGVKWAGRKPRLIHRPTHS